VAGPDRRPDDGGLVPGLVVRELPGRLRRGAADVHVAAVDVHPRHRHPRRGGPADARPHQADQTAHRNGQLTAPAARARIARSSERRSASEWGGAPRADKKMVLEKYKQKRNFTTTP